MKSTNEMIKETEIWAGLNSPDIDKKDADIAVFGIPFDGGVSFRSGRLLFVSVNSHALDGW